MGNSVTIKYSPHRNRIIYTASVILNGVIAIAR